MLKRFVIASERTKTWLSASRSYDTAKVYAENFDDTKGINISRKSKDRQCKDQKETKMNGQMMVNKTLHRKLQKLNTTIPTIHKEKS